MSDNVVSHPKRGLMIEAKIESEIAREGPTAKHIAAITDEIVMSDDVGGSNG